ncbi:MAG: winged helix-turn-helix domain-containing protein [Acidibacillus sp.]|nr:winged helix-turn-helix domain-containing protein [Acidibacillus sp.]
MDENIHLSETCVIDMKNHTVCRRGKILKLSDIQFRLLGLLIDHTGEPVSVEKIIECIWGNKFGEQREDVRVQIRRLRNRIEIEPSNPNIILSVR